MNKLKAVTNDWLRNMLAEEIENLRGAGNNPNAKDLNAIVNAAGKILTSAKLEMEYSRLIGVQADIGFIDIKPVTKALETAVGKKPKAVAKR